MSRTGKNPIPIPSTTKVSLEGRRFTAKGPKGEVSETIIDPIDLEIADGELRLTRPDDGQRAKARHGLMRALLANAVRGVSDGFTKELEIFGVGYRGEMQGSELRLRLGFSHDVVYAVPDGIKVEIDKNNVISVTGADRQQVGQVAAEIRSLRKPDAYKGKGIRYRGEVLRLKVGKAGAGG